MFHVYYLTAYVEGGGVKLPPRRGQATIFAAIS